MNRLIEPPPFVLEAFEGEADSDEAVGFAHTLERGVGEQLAGLAPDAESVARLMRAVEQPPQRYAPFCARLAELLDVSEDVAFAELSRLAEPGVWRFAGWPGIHKLAVKGGAALAAAETLFVRFAPGTRFPRHRHVGLERVLVLEGEYSDSGGVVHRPGEVRDWPIGSEHSFRVSSESVCVFASVVYGRRFSAPPLRLLARVLGS